MLQFINNGVVKESLMREHYYLAYNCGAATLCKVDSY